LNKLQYLDKQDDREVMLRYSAHEMAYNLSYKALDFINTTEVFHALIKVMSRNYVDLYYLKMIYEAFLPIAHQLVIFQKDKQQYGNAPENIIDANCFPCKALLWEIWSENYIEFSYSSSTHMKNRTKEALKKLVKKQKNLFYSFKE